MFMMFYSVTVSRISKAILLHFVGKFINNVYNNNCVYISLLSILFTAEILYIECFFFQFAKPVFDRVSSDIVVPTRR